MDGTTSKHDWGELVSMKHLPLVINPKKGYFASANNRVVPDNSRFDFGSGRPTTGRFLRISEMIEDGIKSGKKFGVQDMIDM